MATNSDTMLEGLKALLTDLAKLKVLPDADMQFLGDLETMIVTYVKQAGQGQINGAMGQPGAGAGAAGGMGNPMGPGDATMGMSAGMGQAQQIAPGGGAGMSGLAPQQPMNGDELRRILQPPTG